ncbi:MAG: thiamine pyrophosphate-binding protein [Dehalococcoidales bacterium]|nr:thiamine pyrophosphate-binding protein [Dehalococcoidales bacterium]
MRMTGAQIMCESLVEEGVEVIFGLPGVPLIPLLDSLPRYPQLRHVLVRHEQGAAHAADGYARVSGKVGVCLATSGPGATNLVTGIANAYLDSVPIVAITGQVARPFIGKDSFQETDITGIVSPITKDSFLVLDVDSLAGIVKESFYIARTGQPGPVLIDIPKDVFTDQAEYCYPDEVKLPGYNPTLEERPARVNQAAEVIDEAERLLEDAGGGGSLLPQYVMSKIFEVTGGEAIVVTGVGQHQMWAAQHYCYDRPNSLISSGGLGTMGFGLPGAIGAKIGCPDRTVWCVDGDGSFQMTIQELATMMQEGLAVKIAIINNGYLGMVRQWQQLFYDKRYVATPLSGPDFVKLAEAYGIPAVRVKRREEVVPAVEQAMEEEGAFLIDFVVEPEENVYPMVPPGAALAEIMDRPKDREVAG